MSYGLLSAFSWGISALLAAVAARRVGALRTVVIGEAAGLPRPARPRLLARVPAGASLLPLHRA